MHSNILIAGFAAIALTGGVALAQTPSAPSEGGGKAQTQAGQTDPRFSVEDRQAFVDARLAGAKAGLRLTPEQEKLWGPVETAARAIATERLERMEQMRKWRESRRENRGEARERPDFMGTIDRMADNRAKSAANLTAFRDAMKPLWASLDERQKRLLPQLVRPMRAELRGMGGRGERGGWHHRRHHGGGEGPRWQRGSIETPATPSQGTTDL